MPDNTTECKEELKRESSYESKRMGEINEFLKNMTEIALSHPTVERFMCNPVDGVLEVTPIYEDEANH